MFVTEYNQAMEGCSVSRYFGSKQPENVGIYIKIYTESLIRTWFRRFHLSVEGIELVIIASMGFIEEEFDREFLDEKIDFSLEDPVLDGIEDANDDDFCRDYGLLVRKKPTPEKIQLSITEVLKREYSVKTFLEASGEFGDLGEINKLDRPEDEYYGFGLS